MPSSFWMVWNPEGNAPRFKHDTIAAAVTEAERLARLNRGAEFYVLMAVEVRQVDDMKRITLHPEGSSDERFELPF